MIDGNEKLAFVFPTLRSSINHTLALLRIPLLSSRVLIHLCVVIQLFFFQFLVFRVVEVFLRMASVMAKSKKSKENEPQHTQRPSQSSPQAHSS
jgi:hypothetical protein